MISSQNIQKVIQTISFGKAFLLLPFKWNPKRGGVELLNPRWILIWRISTAYVILVSSGIVCTILFNILTRRPPPSATTTALMSATMETFGIFTETCWLVWYKEVASFITNLIKQNRRIAQIYKMEKALDGIESQVKYIYPVTLFLVLFQALSISIMISQDKLREVTEVLRWNNPVIEVGLKGGLGLSDVGVNALIGIFKMWVGMKVGVMNALVVIVVLLYANATFVSQGLLRCKGGMKGRDKRVSQRLYVEQLILERQMERPLMWPVTPGFITFISYFCIFGIYVTVKMHEAVGSLLCLNCGFVVISILFLMQILFKRLGFAMESSRLYAGSYQSNSGMRLTPEEAKIFRALRPLRARVPYL